MSVADAVKENKPLIEYTISNGLHGDIKLKTDIISENNALTKINRGFQTTREELNESITFPSRSSFIKNNLLAILKIYSELNYENPSVIESSFKILEKCSLNGKMDITASKSGQGEVLIYRKQNGRFTNILIDEDGDISFLKFGKNIEDKQVEFFSSESKLDYNKIVSLL